MMKNSKIRRLCALFPALLLVFALLTGCAGSLPGTEGSGTQSSGLSVVTLPPAGAEAPENTPEEPPEQAPENAPEEPPEQAPESAPEEPPAEPQGVREDGEYSSPEEVAEYLHLYGHLPSNYITKKEAQNLGWNSREGNLWEVAPGKSIGGDTFGNREGLLPKGRYRECDVNFDGGYRGSERLIYGEDGSIWYTSDHYESFTQLY